MKENGFIFSPQRFIPLFQSVADKRWIEGGRCGAGSAYQRHDHAITFSVPRLALFGRARAAFSFRRRDLANCRVDWRVYLEEARFHGGVHLFGGVLLFWRGTGSRGVRRDDGPGNDITWHTCNWGGFDVASWARKRQKGRMRSLGRGGPISMARLAPSFNASCRGTNIPGCCSVEYMR